MKRKSAKMPKNTTSFFKDINLFCASNNSDHRTKEISKDQLIVRRGLTFVVSITLTESFLSSSENPLLITATTGKYASQEQGTMCYLSVPDGVERSPNAKAVWKLDVYTALALSRGKLILNFTPPANAPIGEYTIMVKYKDEEKLLATPMVLFNPWCPEDAVYMEDEMLRQEYVMNEKGKIWYGSASYNNGMVWDFGQFEDNMVTIGKQVLDLNHKHKKDPALDVSLRWDPAYVSRVISAMMNCQDDKGVLEGNWEGPFSDGHHPCHWSSSSAILTKWLENNNSPVKYGQCWVFAGVMCSVMRFFGIPCRVVTNFASAHDNDANLTIDTLYNEEGQLLEKTDSIWNFHVWVEGWMKRHDYTKDYNGWQVLDPTPQELSDGVFCCGPSPKWAILNGHTDVEFDTAFVYAEINADCVEWMVKEDGSLERMEADTKRVGQFISTKAVGSNDREDLTNTYKPEEGTCEERANFKTAFHRNHNHLKKIREEERRREAEGTVDMEVDSSMRPSAPDASAGGAAEVRPTPPRINITFEEASKPLNGMDVCLDLKLNSKSTNKRPLIINYNIQAMNYNGHPTKIICKDKKEATLQSGKDLTIPIVVKFSDYCKPMLKSDSMKISVIVKDKENPDHPYHADNDMVLDDPPISVTIPGELRVGKSAEAEIIFMNPVNETLKNCTVTISGTGLCHGEQEIKIQDCKPSSKMRRNIIITPYKAGERTLMVDFDCSLFRDIKGSYTVKVME